MSLRAPRETRTPTLLVRSQTRYPLRQRGIWSCVGVPGVEPGTSSVSGKRAFRCATRPCLARSKETGTVEYVGFLIIVIIVAALAFGAGLKAGGHVAVRRIRDFEHVERVRRAGLSRRS
jgi:hypothetical protein